MLVNIFRPILRTPSDPSQTHLDKELIGYVPDIYKSSVITEMIFSERIRHLYIVFYGQIINHEVYAVLAIICSRQRCHS